HQEKGDDYSLGRVPRHKRNMGWISITNITFGIATAIFYFQMGSVMALQFGAINAIISAIYAIVVAGIIRAIFSYFFAQSCIYVKLLSIGGGFGFFCCLLMFVFFF